MPAELLMDLLETILQDNQEIFECIFLDLEIDLISHDTTTMNFHNYDHTILNVRKIKID